MNSMETGEWGVNFEKKRLIAQILSKNYHLSLSHTYHFYSMLVERFHIVASEY